MTKEKILKEFKENKISIILLIIILLICNIKLDYYIFTNGKLVPLDDRIIIENKNTQEGSFNLTYVSSRTGTILNCLIAKIIPSWDIVPLSELNIEGESVEDAEERNKIGLKETSYNSIIAAFKEAKLPYEITSYDIAVTYIYDEAKTNLKVGDIIRKINNKEVKTLDELHEIIDGMQYDEKINIEVERKNKTKNCEATIINSDGKPLIGIALTILNNVNTEPKVEFVFKNNESGASRGLMCALEIYNRITPNDITKGRTISGTGVIDADGNVGAIDGVKYKLIGAVKEKADIFIVPSENYKEAKEIKEKYNYNIEIIEAKTLSNVIESLK